MIIIGVPYKRVEGDFVYYCSNITDDKECLTKEVYYKTTKEYGDFFSYELSDSFLVSMLIKAIATEQDIRVEGFVSTRLYYSLKNTLIDIISYTLNKPAVNITFSKQGGVRNVIFHPTANITGCSMGVDSFAAILSHLSEECPEEFRLTHLALFNVGSYGKGSKESVRKSFYNKLQTVKKFADEVNLPVVSIESNMDVINSYVSQTYVYPMNNVSAYLSMQSLFKNCYIASSYLAVDNEFCAADPFHYENILFPNFSTDNTRIYVANPNMSRFEKTRFICENDLVKKYLNVCWHDEIVNDERNAEYVKYIKLEKNNCSICSKCRRTLLTLDLLGAVKEFSNVFDLKTYYKNKDKYIAYCLYSSKKDAFNKEISEYMKKNNYNVSLKSRMYLMALKFNVHHIFSKIIKKKLYSNN